MQHNILISPEDNSALCGAWLPSVDEHEFHLGEEATSSLSELKDCLSDLIPLGRIMDSRSERNARQ